MAQSRSRDTRRKLIHAALELWDERGFEESFEATTVAEIARAAGVSKGTFYFLAHFSACADPKEYAGRIFWAERELAELGIDVDQPSPEVSRAATQAR